MSDRKIADNPFRLRGTRNIISSEARTSLPPEAQMNDVALCANDVLRNEVMLRINDVAIRANGVKPVVCALKSC